MTRSKYKEVAVLTLEDGTKVNLYTQGNQDEVNRAAAVVNNTVEQNVRLKSEVEKEQDRAEDASQNEVNMAKQVLNWEKEYNKLSSQYDELLEGYELYTEETDEELERNVKEMMALDDEIARLRYNVNFFKSWVNELEDNMIDIKFYSFLAGAGIVTLATFTAHLVM